MCYMYSQLAACFLILGGYIFYFGRKTMWTFILQEIDGDALKLDIW